MLVRDINPSGSSNPASLTAVGNTLFFAANDGVHGTELWKSDGTAAGTRMVKNIRPYGKSSSPMNLTNVNGKLFFTANDGKHGRELWRSDGSKAGTLMIKDIVPGGPNQFGNGIWVHEQLYSSGNQIYFFNELCCIGGEYQLWISDGTAGGTKLVIDRSFELPDGGSAVVQGSRLFFSDFAPEVSGPDYYVRAWVSNGIKSGTHRIAGSPTAYEIKYLPVAGRNAYFVTWISNQEFLTVGRLWKTDGTSAGTKPLTSSGEMEFTPDTSVLMGGRLYFGDSGMRGSLWRTDGTASGTKEVSSSPVAFLVAAGGLLYFSAHGALLSSDGTTAGTHVLMQSDGTWLRHLVAVGDDVIFCAPDVDAGTWTLWQSDGTTNGTQAIKAFVNLEATNSPGASAGGRFFFAADDSAHGAELWSYTP